jgi:asparagine synthase (glutamine-hydrolysing)
MWAFAIYDSRTKELFLSRDRFGEKPLYFYRCDEGLYFGSEIKFIFALLGRKLKVNKNHLMRYLFNGYRSLYKHDCCFYEGIERIERGSCLVKKIDGTEVIQPYWRNNFNVEPMAEVSYEQIVSAVREKLFDAVNIRLRADVPIAFCMSGGVDSNALISIAKRVFDYDVHGFTIANDDKRYDESEFVDQMVGQLGIKHTYVPVDTTDFLTNLKTLINYHDAPVSTISYYAHWLLMRQVHNNGYRISVSGTGADELFTGYYDHHLFYLNEVRGDQELFARSLKAWQEHVKTVVRNPILNDESIILNNPGIRTHLYNDRDVFAELFYDDLGEQFFESNYHSSVLRNRMLNELLDEVVPIILHEDDLNAMYYSIENRSPFLDRRLLEYTLNIPPKYLIRDGMAKVVLRDALEGIMPEPVRINRKKVGFNASILSFLDLNDAAVKTELLRDSPVYEIIKRKKIKQMLESNYLDNSSSKFLFSFLCAKIFLEHNESCLTQKRHSDIKVLNNV